MKKTKASHEEWEPAHPYNWNFDPVPDEEIIACCLWEYARESPSIKMGADIHWCNVRHIWNREEYRQNAKLKTDDDKEAAIIEGRAKRAGFDYEAFRSKFWETDFPLIEIYESITEYVGEWAHSWQRLSKQLRTHLSNGTCKSTVLHPLAQARMGDLEQLWNINRTELEEVRSCVRPVNDDSEIAALYNESAPLLLSEDTRIQPGRVVSALVVDFSRFTDKEIAEAFVRWLSGQRPKCWDKPKRVFPGGRQKGRKLIEYRVALDRLGLMRLLHFHTPGVLRANLPEAWKKLGRKQKYFRREIREARKYFRKLFPFLPANEKLESETRMGVWLPPMLEICEEIDRKTARRGH